MKKKFLFLLAWVDGSDSAMDNADLSGSTHVHVPSDLLPQYQAGNEEVFAVEVLAETEDLAIMCGTARAFHVNFTGYDTVSDCIEVTSSFTSLRSPNETLEV